MRMATLYARRKTSAMFEEIIENVYHSMAGGGEHCVHAAGDGLLYLGRVRSRFWRAGAVSGSR
jgi:hypothetical protein